MVAATPLEIAPALRSSYRMPPCLTTADGRPRKVGVEIEFGGLSVEDASSLVQRLYGGEIEPTNRFTTVVKGTRLGDFRVEIDSMPLKKQGYKTLLDKIGAGDAITGVVEDVLEHVIRQWVPSEIVTSPLALGDLQELDVLRWALLADDAEGTSASPLYGFGFQLNPELPALDAPTMTRYLRSFLALYDWLAAVVDVDPTRRLGPYVDPFPTAYRRKVMAADYAPDVDALIADYLTESPTRNRGLDMLPVFATLRHDLVLERAEEHEQVKPRPTFHYRLPNCLIDDPKWSFDLEWNRWVEIERLAEDAPRLDAVCAEVLGASEGAPSREDVMERARAWGIEAP